MLVVRALPVSSKSLGFSGECDVVEFHQADDGVKLHGHRGFYQIYPIEYKKREAQKHGGRYSPGHSTDHVSGRNVFCKN